MTEELYAYSGANPLLPSSQATTNSLGETLQTEYKYPQDLTSGYEQSSLMQEMVNRNMIATPVKTVTKNNGTVISEQRTLYDEFPGQGSSQMILPEFIYAKKGAGTTSADKKITYDKYEEKGNLQQYTLADGTPVSIIWGYNKQYPIAKVEGVAYASISSTKITNAVNASNLDTSETTEDTLRTKLQELRADSSVNGAVVTTYTYDPLIGVTSVTSPNGQTEYYQYDGFGRLKEVYIKDGTARKILKTVDYNYQHQP